MSLFTVGDVLKGLVPTAAQQSDALELCREELTFINPAAVTTTTAIAEIPFFIARRKQRVVGARFSPGAAVTGNAAFFSLILTVRHIAAPATAKVIATYSPSATPAGDIAAFGSRDLWASGDVNAAAADADFILLPGDVVTFQVTKPGSMTFPAGVLDLITEFRD